MVKVEDGSQFLKFAAPLWSLQEDVSICSAADYSLSSLEVGAGGCCRVHNFDNTPVEKRIMDCEDYDCRLSIAG